MNERTIKRNLRDLVVEGVLTNLVKKIDRTPLNKLGDIELDYEENNIYLFLQDKLMELKSRIISMGLVEISFNQLRYINEIAYKECVASISSVYSELNIIPNWNSKLPYMNIYGLKKEKKFLKKIKDLSVYDTFYHVAQKLESVNPGMFIHQYAELLQLKDMGLLKKSLETFEELKRRDQSTYKTGIDLLLKAHKYFNINPLWN